MKPKCFLSVIISSFLFIFSAAAQNKKAEIQLSGYISVNTDFKTKKGKISIGKINNFRYGGTSGTLYVAVWLTKKRYKGKTINDSYKLTDVRIEALKGGYEYSDLEYDISWNTEVPDGEYYISLILMEYDPSVSGSYRVLDWYGFPEKFTVKSWSGLFGG